MSESNLHPMLAQLHAADDDAARADVLLRMPDSIMMKYVVVIGRSCEGRGFALGADFANARTVCLLAPRDADGALPAKYAQDLEQLRAGMVAVAAGMISGRTTAPLPESAGFQRQAQPHRPPD